MFQAVLPSFRITGLPATPFVELLPSGTWHLDASCAAAPWLCAMWLPSVLRCRTPGAALDRRPDPRAENRSATRGLSSAVETPPATPQHQIKTLQTASKWQWEFLLRLAGAPSHAVVALANGDGAVDGDGT